MIDSNTMEIRLPQPKMLDVHRRTNADTVLHEHSILPNRRDPPDAIEQQPPLSGMANIREANRNAGLSEKASQLLIKGWRKGTRTAYNAIRHDIPKFILGDKEIDVCKEEKYLSCILLNNL